MTGEWNDVSENNLNIMKNKCGVYKLMHDETSELKFRKNKIYNVFNIFFTTILGVVSILQSSGGVMENDTYKRVSDISYPILLFSVSLVNTLQQTYKYESIGEQHRVHAIRFNALYLNIERVLLLNRENRTTYKEYIEWVSNQYDNLCTSSLKIPDSVRKKEEERLKQIPSYTLGNNLMINMEVVSDASYKLPEEAIEMDKTEAHNYEIDRMMINCYR